MALRLRKPTTPAQRHMTVPDFTEVTKKRPEKRLLRPLKKHAGRDKTGQISVRHRGGGQRRQYRIIDFRRLDHLNEPANVVGIEYDPNRTTRIALIEYPSGVRSYVLAPGDLAVGATIMAADKGEPQVGNRFPLAALPTGVPLYNLELEPGRGGQIVRAAGGSATLIAKEGTYGLVRLPSGEVRKFHLRCAASIGTLSFPENKAIRYSKAGRIRYLGIRPTVRGKAMNVNQHPHGGGEGRSPIGLKHPKTPWGKPALGVKTRRNTRTNRFIVKRRK